MKRIKRIFMIPLTVSRYYKSYEKKNKSVNIF